MSRFGAFAALTCAVSCCLPAAASADRDFTARYSANDTGDITIVANALMSCPNSDPACAGARNGIGSSLGALQNNAYAMTYVDVDSDSATFDSSTANLGLPAGGSVLFAGLYWGGDYSGSGSNAAPNAANRNKVVLKAPGDSAYRNVTAATLDDSVLNAGRYQGFADVTPIVAAAGNGTYAVGNVQAGKGSDHYAGWSLVVAYRDTTQPARNLTVFDGLKTVNGSGGATIPVSGFKTPPAGPVRTTLGFITYEGDLGIEGDAASLDSTPLVDALNPSDNFFNSTVSNKGVRFTAKNPDYVNQLGVDADLFNANGILANNATSATIRTTTSGDVYLPGVLTFATELFAPKIEQTKTVTDVNGGQVEEGDVLEYKIAGTNSGQDAAVGFTVRDPIPANSTYVPGSLNVASGAGGPSGVRTDAAGDDSGEYDATNNRVVARLGTGANATAGGKVAVGATYDVRFRVRVGASLPPGTTIENTATSSFFSESLNTPLTAASTARSTVTAPDLAIVKHRNGPLVPGSSSSYDLTVSNAGDAPVRGTPTTVTDTLPATLIPTSASGTGWSCSIAGQTLTCTRSDGLAVGASFPAIHLAVGVDPNATGTIQNTGTVSNPADAQHDNDSSLDPSPVSPSSDLSIVKTASPSSVAAGDQVSFQLTIRNGGPSAARNVSVLDPLPTGLTLLSATPSQGTCSSGVSCALGTLAQNGSATIVIVARAESGAAGTTLRNTATVSGDQPDPNPADNSSSADVSVGGADLSITKTIDDDHPIAGQPITYTLTVRNDGPSPASSVSVHDSLPSQLGAITTDRAECAVAGRVVDCALGSLAPGSTQAIHVSATVNSNAPDGGLSNTASVSGSETDPDPSDNSATADADIGSSADLSVVKTGDPNQVGAGGEIIYTLIAHNDGPSFANNVRLIDQLPAGVSFESAAPGCSLAASTVTCTLAPLAPGGTVTRRIVVRVNPGAVGSVTNTARITADTADPDDSDNASSTTTPIASQADLSLTKSVSPANARPGDTVTYTLTVRNAGVDAEDVSLSDTLPGGLTFTGSNPGAPGCGLASGVISCDLGTVAAGSTRTVTVTATVDPVAMPAGHQHLLPVEKVEQQVDLDPGQTRSLTLSCAQPGEIMTDATVRADAVDQGTGTLASIETQRARSSDRSSYEFIVSNTAGGRAQAKLFGVCIPGATAVEQGHSHRVIVGDPVTVTAPLTPGRHDLSVACGTGQVAIAPGIDVDGGAARLVASEPDGTGRRFTVEVGADATVVTLSVRCMDTRLDTAAGHTHDLELTEVHRTVIVPANSTVNESVICPDDAKGIVASYQLAAGLQLAGHDPQPKTRVFKLVNPTSQPLTAELDLLCLGDRTGGAVVTNQIVNSATVSSPTPDVDSDDQAASATLEVTTGDVQPPPAPPGPPTPTSVGTARVTGTKAALSDGQHPEVIVPVSCDDGPCAGSLTLRAVAGTEGIPAGRRIGGGAYELGAPGAATVSVVLGGRAAKLARKGRLRRLEVVIRSGDPAAPQIASRVLKLRST